MDYKQMLMNIEDSMYNLTAEYNDVMSTLCKTKETDDEYLGLLDTLKSLSEEYNRVYKAYEELKYGSRSLLKRFGDAVAKKAMDVDPNLIIKLIGLFGLVAVITMLERSENPVAFRSRPMEMINKIGL